MCISQDCKKIYIDNKTSTLYIPKNYTPPAEQKDKLTFSVTQAYIKQNIKHVKCHIDTSIRFVNVNDISLESLTTYGKIDESSKVTKPLTFRVSPKMKTKMHIESIELGDHTVLTLGVSKYIDTTISCGSIKVGNHSKIFLWNGPTVNNNIVIGNHSSARAAAGAMLNGNIIGGSFSECILRSNTTVKGKISYLDHADILIRNSVLESDLSFAGNSHFGFKHSTLNGHIHIGKNSKVNISKSTLSGTRAIEVGFWSFLDINDTKVKPSFIVDYSSNIELNGKTIVSGSIHCQSDVDVILNDTSIIEKQVISIRGKEDWMGHARVKIFDQAMVKGGFDLTSTRSTVQVNGEQIFPEK